MMLSACSDYVGKEKSHPLYVKAGKEKSAGEYKEAARCYEEFLLICPKSSRTHHELGNIYSDYLNDPLRAVYHYRKWMEMNPDDKTNFEDVRLMAETAQKNLFKKLKEEYKESGESKQQSEEFQKLRDQLAQTQASLKQCEEQNQKMKERPCCRSKRNGRKSMPGQLPATSRIWLPPHLPQKKKAKPPPPLPWKKLQLHLPAKRFPVTKSNRAIPSSRFPRNATDHPGIII